MSRTLPVLALLATCVLLASAPAAADEAEAADTPQCDLPESHGSKVHGAVLETMDAAGYTYVRLDTGGEGTWVAVPETEVALGDCLALRGGSMMVDFESRTLERTFDEIYFGTLAQNSDESLLSAANGEGQVEEPEIGNVTIDKAEGADARTVAEVFAQSAELAGKAVVVRGQVTKVTEGIMSRNWIHLVDGSGSEGGGDGSLIVTTAATGVAVGEVVEARGTVAVDLDLGFGYKYDVLVQDATIAR